jgi:thiol-disulfide isomerase/thioredoxin
VLGLVVVVAVLAVATIGGLIYRSRSGRLTSARSGELPAGLIDEPADAVTLLHFSSATCAPCRQVRALAVDLSTAMPGVRHVEIDADEHLDAARELDIWRLPTLLVVDRQGRIAQRAVGVPDRAALTAAVSEVLGGMSRGAKRSANLPPFGGQAA